MGGEYREVIVVGKDFSTAWKAFQDEEREERGSDFYNGSMHHVGTPRLLDNKTYIKERDKMNLSKCEGIATCTSKPIKNDLKIKTEVKRYPNKGARKWETRYVVYSNTYDSEPHGSFKFQDEAIKKARELCENMYYGFRVDIEKHLISDKVTVAQITYKKSSKQKDGRWIAYALVPW
jgi:hypothetical protein